MRLAAGICVSLLVARAEGETAPASGPPCAPDNGGIALPMGFCATVFADGIGTREISSCLRRVSST